MAGSTTNFPNVQRIRDMVRNDLASLLDSFKGKKDLVLDTELMKPLDRVAGATMLKQRQVDKIFKLDPTQKSIHGCEQRVYLVRPQMTTMKVIADHVNSDRSSNIKREYRIIMVPRKLHVCEMILEHEGVMGYITIHELQMDLIPLDRDILSLELPQFFRSFYLDSDHTWIQTIAKSLINIQALCGIIPNVYGIGKGSKMVNDLMKNILGEKLSGPDYSKCDIGNLILIDRDVDFVTPLCSQLTYEGLLDDTFGISCGYIEFGKDVTGKDQSTKLLLSSEDQIFDEVRNRHFSNVFEYLSSKAKSLQTEFDQRHGLESVGDMKDFVATKLRGLKAQKAALSHHIGACEVILGKKTKGEFEEYLQTEHSLLEGTALRENMTFIEELINKQSNMLQTLKLLCLLSLTLDGIPARDYKSLKKQYCQSHGFEQMLTFYNLSKLGMITDQELTTIQPATSLGKVTSSMAAMTKHSSFKSLCRRLALIPKTDDINLKSPTDMSYVFSGAYSPLSCKLVEQALTRETFLGMEEITKHLPGGVFAEVNAKQAKGKMPSSLPPSSKVVLVYFLGGCTYSEISALRFLGRLKGYRFLVATTSIITGTSLLEQVVEKPPI
ncbi:vacuolar protein sorting-associated protein 33B-like [Mytilus trossulus]|uniref:vacuolar protein sorting-associated protein 33B-like n=1 Tax=Mytilus trossulus TaxID=6551 RepID=UPI003007799B